jgi:hypothetical protein
VDVRSEYSGQLQELMTDQNYAVLSTRRDDGQPYASLVAFWASEDLREVVFCTLRSTRKFANLIAEGRVALLVDSRSNRDVDLQLAAAATVLGSCQEAEGEERSRLARCFLEKHPGLTDFLKSPGCAVMRLDVRSYYLVTRFQNVIELHVGPGN